MLGYHGTIPSAFVCNTHTQVYTHKEKMHLCIPQVIKQLYPHPLLPILTRGFELQAQER